MIAVGLGVSQVIYNIYRRRQQAKKAGCYKSRRHLMAIPEAAGEYKSRQNYTVFDPLVRPQELKQIFYHNLPNRIGTR